METSSQSSDVVVAMEALVRSLVDRPEYVKIGALDGSLVSVLEVQVAAGDVGKVLGRGGRTIGACRELLAGISGATKRRFMLEVLEPDERTAATTSRQ